MTEEKKPTVRDTIVAISTTIRGKGFGTGRLAELRRMETEGGIVSGVFHMLAAEHLPDTELRGERLRRWALVIKMAALAAGIDGWSKKGFGSDVAENDISESRFLAFLAARGEKLDTLALRIVRTLVAKGKPVDVPALGSYLMAELEDGSWADDIRTKFARDFYRVQHQQNKAA